VIVEEQAVLVCPKRWRNSSTNEARPIF